MPLNYKALGFHLLDIYVLILINYCSDSLGCTEDMLCKVFNKF